MRDETKSGVEKDEFPIGLRVLSVDDNMTCLKVLEAKLLHCRYHVTSTTSAIDALNILRMNKNKFDIIVTDVHMPDMDGFKLLEHVGLEMDLPCIMLSGNDDPKIVMKGIEHGACDYLLKPVRVEELKNIWQHVIRKKKSCKEQNHSDNTTSEDGQENTNRNSHKKKRKDQNDDQEEEDEEATVDNESVSKKKPRVVWTQELHQKFMDALRVLGINKAVPKKILEMMNVEGLSRENVASHLQKYRLYMKKLEEKTNMMTMELREFPNPATFGSFNDFQAFSSSAPSLPTFQPYQQNTAVNINNPSMLFGNNHIAPSFVTVARPPPMNAPLNTLGSRFLHRMPSSTLLKTPHLSQNSPFNGLPTSHSSSMIHSVGTPNPLPLNPILSNSNNLNFSSSSSLVPHSNITSNNNNNNITVDPMLMLNGTNDGSNYLNFGNAGKGMNPNNSRNITFGSQLGGSQPLVGSGSSHSQLLNSLTNRALRTNANPQPGYNGMSLAQQRDLGSSGCSFSELDNLIKPEQRISSNLPEMGQDPNN